MTIHLPSYLRIIAITSFAVTGIFFGIQAHAAAPQAGLYNATNQLIVAFPQVPAGSSVAAGDVDADGANEIIFGSPPGVRSSIAIYEQDATLVRTIYPYKADMQDGIQVAIGDVTGTGVQEIVTVPRKGAYCKVLRFNAAGKQLNAGFYGLGKPLRTGCTLALGDVDGNGSQDIIAGIGPGDNPDVNVFTASGTKLGVIHVYENSFRGGVAVASFDYDDDGKAEIIVGPFTNRLSDIKVMTFPQGKTLSSFRAYGGFKGGVTMSANTSGGGKRVLLGAGRTGGPHVKQFNTVTKLVDGVNIMPLANTWRGGVNVAFVSYTDTVNFMAVPGTTALSFSELVSLGAAVSTQFTGDSNFSYEKRGVAASSGIFTTHIVRVNLKNPNLKLTSLTAGSKTNCFNVPCPVKSLKSYLDEAGGRIAINGSYFCPSDYSWCSGQAGSFFWLWYNTRTGVFSNSYQNQFNHGPVIAFDEKNQFYYFNPAEDWQGKAAFESVTKEKLRAAISCGPNLIIEGKVTVAPSDLDTKQLTVKSNRSGIGFRGDDMYLVVTTGATVIDLGNVMKALGMQYATNLDGGGSSALIYDGAYKIGPGRSLPNALVIGG